MAGDKSQVDRLLDAGLFAPLGFLLTRDETIADLAAAGRKQVAFSRSLGRAALKGITKGTQASSASAKPASKPEPSAESVAVDGYRTMTARQVVALAASCSDAQASWIRSEESQGKNRVTIMRALDARG